MYIVFSLTDFFEIRFRILIDIIYYVNFICPCLLYQNILRKEMVVDHSFKEIMPLFILYFCISKTVNVICNKITNTVCVFMFIFHENNPFQARLAQVHIEVRW